MDGQRYGSDYPKIIVPVIVPGEPGIGSGAYLFNTSARMWIWQGGMIA